DVGGGDFVVIRNAVTVGIDAIIHAIAVYIGRCGAGTQQHLFVIGEAVAVAVSRIVGIQGLEAGVEPEVDRSGVLGAGQQAVGAQKVLLNVGEAITVAVHAVVGGQQAQR